MQAQTHYATPEQRVAQIRAAYAMVEWSTGGRMLRASRAKWLAWLDAFGIGEARAKQLMRKP